MTDPTGVSSADMRAALASVLKDERLAHTERLRGFLTYIVEEEVVGRGNDIRGKTIAQDVYGRVPSDGPDPENVVRVDARRLRQILELHY
ncbi:MAG: tetratricopeptide repeat protein, partial [Ruegeria sp.]